MKKKKNEDEEMDCKICRNWDFRKLVCTLGLKCKGCKMFKKRYKWW